MNVLFEISCALFVIYLNRHLECRFEFCYTEGVHCPVLPSTAFGRHGQREGGKGFPGAPAEQYVAPAP